MNINQLIRGKFGEEVREKIERNLTRLHSEALLNTDFFSLPSGSKEWEAVIASAEDNSPSKNPDSDIDDLIIDDADNVLLNFHLLELAKALKEAEVYSDGKFICDRDFNLSDQDKEALELYFNQARVSPDPSPYLDKMVTILQKYCQKPPVH